MMCRKQGEETWAFSGPRDSQRSAAGVNNEQRLLQHPWAASALERSLANGAYGKTPSYEKS